MMLYTGDSSSKVYDKEAIKITDDKVKENGRGKKRNREVQNRI